MTVKTLNTVWGSLILLFVIFWAFFLGLDSAHNEVKQSILDGIMLAFWIFFLIFWYFSALRDQKRDIEFERDMDDIKKKGDDLLKDILKEAERHATVPHIHAAHPGDPIETRLNSTLLDIVKEVSGEKEPNARQIATIKSRFTKLTGHDIKITKDEIGLDVKISKQPLAKKAPVKKPAATKKPVTEKKGK